MSNLPSIIENLPPIISFMAGRGGTGKTSCCLNAASIVAESGNNILIVDLDLAATGATHLILRKSRIRKSKSLTDYLDEKLAPEGQPERRGEEINDVIGSGLPRANSPEVLESFVTDQVTGTLYFIPARLTKLKDSIKKLSEYEAIPTQTIVEILAQTFTELTNLLRLKCIFLDCPAAADNLSEAAGWLSNYSVIVTQPDNASYNAAIEIEGVLKENIPTGNIPKFYWVVNKIMPGVSIQSIKNAFNRHNVAAYIPFEDRVAASYGDFTFTRDLGFSNFEIKLQVMCKTIFGQDFPYLVPDPVKTLNTTQLRKRLDELRIRSSKMSRIFNFGFWLSLIIGSSFFILSVLSAILSNLNPMKTTIDPETGKIITLEAEWYHQAPILNYLLIGLVILVFGVILRRFVVLEKRKLKSMDKDPGGYLRSFFLQYERDKVFNLEDL